MTRTDVKSDKELRGDDAEVAQLFERNDWISAPVVNTEGKLLGRITIDDVVDVIRDDLEHNILSMAGLSDDEETFSSIKDTLPRRAIWLGINLLTALLASASIKMFEGTIDKVVALGFCFGGLCVLDMARAGLNLKGVVSFHGLYSKPNEKNTEINSKVLILHGYKDPLIGAMSEGKISSFLHVMSGSSSAHCTASTACTGDSLTVHAFLCQLEIELPSNQIKGKEADISIFRAFFQDYLH